MQEALWGLGLWILSHTLCSGSAMLFFQGRRAIDRPVPTLGAEQSSQAGMGEVSGATSLLHCLQFALGRFELKFGKKQSENLKHSKRSEGRAQTAFCWQSLCLFQGDFLFLVPFYKISSVLPMSSPEFFNKLVWAQLSAGAEQAVCPWLKQGCPGGRWTWERGHLGCAAALL